MRDSVPSWAWADDPVPFREGNGARVRPALRVGSRALELSRELVRTSEFGPFDLVSDWAHAKYLAGFHTEAVLDARRALAMVTLTDDTTTVLYLHYTIGVALHELGRPTESAVNAQVLLARVDPVTQPYWRAKALSLLAEAWMRDGEMNRAMDAVAEGSAVLAAHPSNAYNHMSASMAVALALRAMYLYEEAERLLMATVRGEDEWADLLVLDEATQLLLYWGATYDLLGRGADARELYVRAASRARRVQPLAQHLDERVLGMRGLVYEAFVHERLGEPQLAEQRLRAALVDYDLRDQLTDGHIARITLARVMSQRGEFTDARHHLKVARRAAFQASRDVWAATALATEAEVDEIEFGEHPGLARMRALSQQVLARMVSDRSSRFADIQARNKVRELIAETERMGQQVREDPLTGLGNRRRLVEYVALSSGVVSAIFVDIDRFKTVNDRFGHAVGDRVLTTIAGMLLMHCRAGDVIVRYGGDEFVVLVEGDPLAATAVADRLHQAIREDDWSRLAAGLAVTVSIGVATSLAADTVLASADQALYSAKRQGRDQVVSA